jgi:hypothetical protein
MSTKIIKNILKLKIKWFIKKNKMLKTQIKKQKKKILVKRSKRKKIQIKVVFRNSKIHKF